MTDEHRSRFSGVIASASEAIQIFTTETDLDCFVALLLAMTVAAMF
jgi:hypothetical protein